MNHQSTTRIGKRRGPAPTGKGVTIGTRLQPDLLALLDAYIARQGGTLTRAAATRAIVAEYLTGAKPKPGKPSTDSQK